MRLWHFDQISSKHSTGCLHLTSWKKWVNSKWRIWMPFRGSNLIFDVPEVIFDSRWCQICGIRSPRRCTSSNALVSSFVLHVCLFSRSDFSRRPLFLRKIWRSCNRQKCSRYPNWHRVDRKASRRENKKAGIRRKLHLGHHLWLKQVWRNVNSLLERKLRSHSLKRAVKFQQQQQQQEQQQQQQQQQQYKQLFIWTLRRFRFSFYQAQDWKTKARHTFIWSSVESKIVSEVDRRIYHARMQKRETTSSSILH